VNKGNSTITELRAILQRESQNPQVIDDQVQCFLNWTILFKFFLAGWKWVSDCCLTPIQQFSAIVWREQVNFQVRFVLDQHV